MNRRCSFWHELNFRSRPARGPEEQAQVVYQILDSFTARRFQGAVRTIDVGADAVGGGFNPGLPQARPAGWTLQPTSNRQQ